ncbi:MAG: hypothetical protein UZ21_OP11001000641 [Microgenomates bacterium OLB22]|nr:MAG: hypothetical protein UZ21_OP11001000641 [Microgenomates bacterium OLB22]
MTNPSTFDLLPYDFQRISHYQCLDKEWLCYNSIYKVSDVIKFGANIKKTPAMAGSEQQPVSHDPHSPEQAYISSAPNPEYSPTGQELSEHERLVAAVKEQALLEIARALSLREFDETKFNRLHIGAINPHTTEGLMVFDAIYIPLSEEEAAEAAKKCSRDTTA